MPCWYIWANRWLPPSPRYAPRLAASLYREGYRLAGPGRDSEWSLLERFRQSPRQPRHRRRPPGRDHAPRSGRRLRTGASRSTDACARLPAGPLLGPRHSNGGLPYRSPPAVERSSAGLPGARRPSVHRRGVRSRGYMKRGEIWTVSGAGYAGKPRPAVIVQDDRFDATASVTIVDRVEGCVQRNRRRPLLTASGAQPQAGRATVCTRCRG